jgi:Protein of unknown function (DUF3131)
MVMKYLAGRFGLALMEIHVQKFAHVPKIINSGYQKKRWEKTDIMTSVSEDSIAAISWSAVFSDDYSSDLREEAVVLKHPKYGFYAGIFEDGKINKSRNITNAVILEAMLYLKMGKKPFISLFRNDNRSRENRRHNKAISQHVSFYRCCRCAFLG